MTPRILVPGVVCSLNATHNPSLDKDTIRRTVILLVHIGTPKSLEGPGSIENSDWVVGAVAGLSGDLAAPNMIQRTILRCNATEILRLHFECIALNARSNAGPLSEFVSFSAMYAAILLKNSDALRAIAPRESNAIGINYKPVRSRNSYERSLSLG
jgi:hypothetical protein